MLCCRADGGWEKEAAKLFCEARTPDVARCSSDTLFFHDLPCLLCSSSLDDEDDESDDERLRRRWCELIVPMGTSVTVG